MLQLCPAGAQPQPLHTERDGQAVRVGREEEDNGWPSVSIADDEVSTEHLEFLWDAGRRQWCCTDLNSSNGTQLNSRRLQPQGGPAQPSWMRSPLQQHPEHD